MKNNSRFSRRSLLQGAAVTAGALAYNGVPGTQLMNRAFGEITPGKSALLVVFLDGGYNAVFPSADAFQTVAAFGITGANAITPIANSFGGLAVDAATFGAKLPATALNHMASIGVRHGISAHGTAKSNVLTDGTRARYLQLAAAMGGDAAIKAAVVGTRMPAGPAPAEGAVSLQVIADMKTTIDALGGGTDATAPDRGITASNLGSAQAMSGNILTNSPNSLKSTREGYATSIETLKKPLVPFSFPALAQAYTPNVAAPPTAVNNFTQQMIAAELMIKSGTNVVIAVDNGWDTHGDRTAANVRNMMNTRILPPLATLLTRAGGGAGSDPVLSSMNIVVAIMGDFSRSLPGSDHQNSLTATVIGPRIKPGTTGKLRVTGTTAANAAMVLDPTPASPELWSFIAGAVGANVAGFPVNPHAMLL